MFKKYGSIFTISDTSEIRTADSWHDFVATQEKKSLAEGVKVHKRKDVNNVQKVICDIDVNKYIIQ